VNLAAVLFDNKFKDQEKLRSFFEITLSKIRNLCDEIYVLSENADFTPPEGIRVLSFKTSHEFLSFIKDGLSGKSVLILNAYSPLLDLESTGKMLEEHERFAFDYTFPENLPAGLFPEILDSGAAGFILRTIPENLPMFKNSVKEVFEKDISSYDCNIYISPCRLINYRINFVPDNYNDYLILKDLTDRKAYDLNHLELEAMIIKNPGIIRKRPTYFEIELNSEREKSNIFISERLDRNSELKINDFRKILSGISEFSYNPAVSLGLYGEPLLYSAMGEIIGEIKKHPIIQFLIESRCLFPDKGLLPDLLNLPNVRIIFDISFTDQESFAANKAPLNKVIPFIGLASVEEIIKSLPNREKIYIQFTRASENENELLRFYEKWRDFSERIIIKKPDTFGGLLDSSRVVDLSPVKRFPCLHLKHDMVIHSDGKVPLCRQDYNAQILMGNALTDGIENCWNNMNKIYQNHWKDEYGLLCDKCDEWWVFNL
jgi:spiro-SPASM protein